MKAAHSLPSLTRCTFLVVLPFVVIGVAHGQDFPPLFGEQRPLQDPDLPAEIRNRVDQLSVHRWFEPTRVIRISPGVSPETSGFVIEVPGERGIRLQRTESSRVDSSRITWFGHDEIPGSYLGLVSGIDGVNATLRIGDKRYVVVPLDDGWHILGLVPTDIDPGGCGTQPVSPVPHSRREGLPEIQHITTGSDGCPSIDVMVAYTDLAATWIPTFQPMIQIDEAPKNAINDINAAIYTNSGIQARLNLVHGYMTETQESFDNLQGDLRGLVDPADAFAPKAHSLRDPHAVDVVVFVGVYPGAEGIAAALEATEATAFALVSALAYDLHDPAVEISPLAVTMAHEIAHLQ